MLDKNCHPIASGAKLFLDALFIIESSNNIGLVSPEVKVFAILLILLLREEDWVICVYEFSSDPVFEDDRLIYS